MKIKKKKRKLNIEKIQKLFCFSSFIFLATCCLWYGGRFVYFYLENEKSIKELETSTTKYLTQTILDNSNLKEINNTHYFQNDASNNYLTYSNLTWRIIKIDNDDTIYLISNDILTTLSNGNNNYINKWLNKSPEENTGILEKNLNDTSKYLTNYNVCNDKINDLNTINCNSLNKDNLIGLLSIIDYINTGGENSFINNEQYTYLHNQNNNNELWYINDEGKLGTSPIENIYGIKPVIRLKSNLEVLSGNGTENNPYTIEKTNNLFGSYVKLGDDTWRIYDIENDNIKLIQTNYLTENNQKVFQKYSNTNYYHDDTINTSLAYYLNNTYLNTLTYQDKINSISWSNYYYGADNNYNYQEVLKNKIDTKVSIPSIGDIILNDNNKENFYTNTGTDNTSNKIYVIKNNGTLIQKSTNYNSNIVPCISINKNLLTKGNGSLETPYEME